MNRAASAAAIPRPDYLIAGQPYWIVATLPCDFADAFDGPAAIWTSFCAACGSRFDFRTQAPRDLSERLYLNRRCSRCKAPRRAVSSRRSRRSP